MNPSTSVDYIDGGTFTSLSLSPYPFSFLKYISGTRLTGDSRLLHRDRRVWRYYQHRRERLHGRGRTRRQRQDHHVVLGPGVLLYWEECGGVQAEQQRDVRGSGLLCGGAEGHV